MITFFFSQQVTGSLQIANRLPKRLLVVYGVDMELRIVAQTRFGFKVFFRR